MPEGRRFKIYPAEDRRVVRVVKKVVRGLSHFHNLETAVDEEQVWADILKFQMPAELIEGVVFLDREPDVLEYWYEAYSDADIRSVWYLKFLETVTFIAAVRSTPFNPVN